MNDLHPARSSEFLSRLHDGELAAAQVNAFDSHRAACVECREAALAFSQSLAAFRSAEPAPAAADLSARILRKIRAQSPSRRPFGVMFGIDIRWAGIFVAALLVILISAPALLRRPEAPVVPAMPPSISARIVDAGPAKEPDRAPQTRADARPPAAAPIAPAPQAAKDEAAAAPLKALAEVVAESPAENEKARPSGAAAPRAKAAAPVLRREVTAADPAGGEAGAANAIDPVVPAPPRLSVRALDGQGAAPALISHLPDERFAPLRGSEFVVVVETQGRVRDVLPSANDGFLARREPSTAQAAPAGAMDALRALRFAPGDRPRRLLIRIE